MNLLILFLSLLLSWHVIIVRSFSFELYSAGPPSWLILRREQGFRSAFLNLNPDDDAPEDSERSEGEDGREAYKDGCPGAVDCFF